MMNRQFRHAAMSMLVLLWSATAFVAGMQFAKQDESQPAIAVPPSAEGDVIEEFRTERQQLRQQQIAQLNDLIHSESADAEIVSMAQERLMDLMEWTEQETTLEGVLRIRDFEDAVVTVHNDSVNIMVRAEMLNQQQTAVILDLVTRETAISGGNVKIIPIN